MATSLYNHGLADNLPEIPNPDSFGNKQEYLEASRRFNLELRTLVEKYLGFQQVLQLVRQRIQEQLAPGGDIDVTIVTVGSDGRLEKCLPSLYEVVALIQRSNNGIQQELQNEIHQELTDIIAPEAVTRTLQADACDPLMKTGVFSDVEVKPLSCPDFLCFNNDPSLKPWPSRIIDALPLGPDDGQLVQAAKRRMIKEVQGKAGSRLIRLENGRHKDARNIVGREGVDRFQGEDIRHYDLERRELYYAPDRHLAALKHGPLRAVQTLCYWKLLQAIREPRNWRRLMKEVPTPTAEKIPYLEDTRVLKFDNHHQAEDLIRLYEYTLWWQHRAGYAHHMHGQDTLTIRPDEAIELKENLEALDARIREVSRKPGN